jgi:hypothetical protein
MPLELAAQAGWDDSHTPKQRQKETTKVINDWHINLDGVRLKMGDNVLILAKTFD